MIKYIFNFSILIIATSMIIASCDSPSEKVVKAQEKVVDAEADLAKAQQEYAEDIERFRAQTAARTEANNRSIAEFNERINKEKKELKVEYQLKITELEQKNSDLKKKLDEYKISSRSEWESFKAEFNREMDQLGDALKDLTEKDNK